MTGSSDTDGELTQEHLTDADLTPGLPEPAAREPRWRWLARLGAAAAGGLVLYAAEPPRPLWWLAPFGVALLCLAVHRRRARAGFGYGFVFGMAWMLPLLAWLLDFLGPGFGPWPWLGVAAVGAVLFALPCTILALTSTVRGAPVLAAATFVLGEAIRDRFPIGGFPWARLAWSQPSGALLSLASVGGAPLLSFAVALAGAGLAHLVLRRVYLVHRHPVLRRTALRRFTGPVAAVLVPVIAGLALLPGLGAGPDTGTVRTMVLQGSGPNIGLDLLNQPEALGRYNARQLSRTAADVAAGRVPHPDLVVIGESVYDPLPGTAPGDLAPVAAAARALGAPVAAGGVARPPDNKTRNVVVGVDAQGARTGEYTKEHLVPFAERVPLRSIARLVTPFLDTYGDMQAGTEPGVLPFGKVRLGVGVCFDIAYDDVLHGAATHGANLLAIPTNNAWYGRSEMTFQQQAMGSIRAVEHDRAVVVAATTGSSAVIAPDGTVTRRTGQFTAEALSAEVPLRTDTTLADRLGAWPEWVITAVALAGLGLGIRERRALRARQSKQGGQGGGHVRGGDES